MKWLSLLKTLVTRIQQRRLWPAASFASGSAIVIAGWVLWPTVLHPYVRIPNSTFSLTLPCVPKEATLLVRTQYAVLRKAQLILLEPGTEKAARAQFDLGIKVTRKDSEIIYGLTTTEPQIKQVIDAERPFNDRSSFAISLTFAKIPSIDLSSAALTYAPASSAAACHPETLVSYKLREGVQDPSASVRSYTLIQEKLSDIVLSANEAIGNLLLAVLLLMFLWLIVRLTDALRRVYLTSDEDVRLEMNKQLPADISDRGERLAQTIRTQYAHAYKNLSFMRVFGPATGFLLTVSSLISGLHPSATAAQDTFRFVSSLQLALVATFMGLAVRIMAELALRYRREDAERCLEVLE